MLVIRRRGMTAESIRLCDSLDMREADPEKASIPEESRNGSAHRLSVPPPWIWILGATGLALVMPPALEAAHYMPHPSLERRPNLDWASVVWWAAIVLGMFFFVPWIIRNAYPAREASFATRLTRTLAMLAMAGFLIKVGLSDHWGWQVHVVDWSVAAGWLVLVGIRIPDLIRAHVRPGN